MHCGILWDLQAKKEDRIDALYNALHSKSLCNSYALFYSCIHSMWELLLNFVE